MRRTASVILLGRHNFPFNGVKLTVFLCLQVRSFAKSLKYSDNYIRHDICIIICII
ncbi:hypothetical protein MCHI_002956 [Candidatus Magnetoovum chiemensis]|nr:hypothetical protein MCHI_002956 [Candidatus Magnetoovum chiemensis]